MASERPYVETIILLDGAMATELAARGVPTTGPAWSAHALELAPDVVRAVHYDHEWRAAGATILGSCCGTSPEHTAALARAFGGRLAGASR